MNIYKYFHAQGIIQIFTGSLQNVINLWSLPTKFTSS